MKRLSTSYVALARIADHAAAIYHRLGDIDNEEHERQLQRHYMDQARIFKSNEVRHEPQHDQR